MNIFIAKLNSKTNNHSLEVLFSGFGTVDSAKVIMDRDTGRSKCFGFVEMSNDQEALAAIENLNETEFEGSKIVVKKSEPRENSGNRNQFKRRSYSSH